MNITVLFMIGFASLILLFIGGPIVLPYLPKPVLNLLCFLPTGASAFWGVQAFAQHNMVGGVLSLLGICLTLYGGFSLQDLIPKE